MTSSKKYSLDFLINSRVYKSLNCDEQIFLSNLYEKALVNNSFSLKFFDIESFAIRLGWWDNKSQELFWGPKEPKFGKSYFNEQELMDFQNRKDEWVFKPSECLSRLVRTGSSLCERGLFHIDVPNELYHLLNEKEIQEYQEYI